MTYNVVFLGIAAVSLVLLAFAARDYRKASRSISSYFLLDGKLQFGPFVATYLATNWSLGNLVWFSAMLGYFYGFSYMIVLLVGYLVMIIVYFSYLPRFQSYIEDRRNVGSVHEYISIAYLRPSGGESSPLRLLTSISTVLGLLVALVLEMYLAATLLNATLGISVPNIMVGMIILISLYTALSGFWSVVVTDVVQALIQVVAFIALVCFFVGFTGAFKGYEEHYSLDPSMMLADFGWAGTLSIFVIVAAFYLVTMDTWQRSAATRSFETTKWGMITSTILVFLSNGVFVGLGMFDNLFIQTNFQSFGGLEHSAGNNPLADLFLLGALDNGMVDFALGIIAIALLMAAISTADTLLIVCGHSFVSDAIIGAAWGETYGSLNPTENRTAVSLARSTVVIVGLLVIATWKFLEWVGALFDPLTLFFISYSLQYVLLAPVLFSKLTDRPSSSAALAAVMGGLLASLVSGFGGFVASAHGIESVVGLGPSEWTQLSPVFTAFAGILVLAICVGYEYVRKATRRTDE